VCTPVLLLLVVVVLGYTLLLLVVVVVLGYNLLLLLLLVMLCVLAPKGSLEHLRWTKQSPTWSYLRQNRSVEQIVVGEVCCGGVQELQLGGRSIDMRSLASNHEQFANLLPEWMVAHCTVVSSAVTNQLLLPRL